MNENNETNSTEETKIDDSKMLLYGVYGDIKIKGGEVKFTVAVPLNEMSEKLAKLAENSGEKTQIALGFMQTELDV